MNHQLLSTVGFSEAQVIFMICLMHWGKGVWGAEPCWRVQVFPASSYRRPHRRHCAGRITTAMGTAMTTAMAAAVATAMAAMANGHGRGRHGNSYGHGHGHGHGHIQTGIKPYRLYESYNMM